ncbi:HD domain-containing protein [Lactobacillus sp. S2-2]|uniref:HD domain-containing protein n=1 Tax=Lactobacillus sp. S2-2 TaxID=2692917 RepID=UPI001F48AED4|nr:HD domain-containing protein [Lactobacillus sp. S2-2]MCF6515288.1 HD domain-containing protein [Lactobacillus sp. S2-2]
MDKIKQIEIFSQQIMQINDDSHSFNHIKRVIKLAKQIMKNYKVDYEVILTSIYLHDSYDEKIFEDVIKQKQIVQNKLIELDFSEIKIKKIFSIIDSMSFSENLVNKKELDLEGQIVQDSDRLDAIGALGIARAFYYGGKFGEVMYDKDILPRKKLNKEEYREPGTVINHFYEKLLKIKDQLNTSEAKKIGEKRQRIMLDFLDDFIDEAN